MCAPDCLLVCVLVKLSVAYISNSIGIDTLKELSDLHQQHHVC